MKRVLARLAAGTTLAAASVIVAVEAARDPARLWAISVAVGLGVLMVFSMQRRRQAAAPQPAPPK